MQKLNILSKYSELTSVGFFNPPNSSKEFPNKFKLKFKEIFDSKSKEYEDLSLVKEEIENRFVQQLKNISSNIQFDIGYPKYNFEVVWITLSFNNKQIVVEWQKDFGYGIHSDNVGGFPIVERYESLDLVKTTLKEIFEI